MSSSRPVVHTDHIFAPFPHYFRTKFPFCTVQLYHFFTVSLPILALTSVWRFGDLEILGDAREAPALRAQENEALLSFEVGHRQMIFIRTLILAEVPVAAPPVLHFRAEGCSMRFHKLWGGTRSGLVVTTNKCEQLRIHAK